MTEQTKDKKTDKQKKSKEDEPKETEQEDQQATGSWYSCSFSLAAKYWLLKKTNKNITLQCSSYGSRKRTEEEEW